jgi:hypothetical protein
MGEFYDNGAFAGGTVRLVGNGLSTEATHKWSLELLRQMMAAGCVARRLGTKVKSGVNWVMSCDVELCDLQSLARWRRWVARTYTGSPARPRRAFTQRMETAWQALQ